MNDPVETYEHAGLRVELHWDEMAGNPRKEFDHAGTMVAFPILSRNWDLADRDSTGTEDEAHERRVGLLERYLRITEGAELVFFYFADHGSSGARLYETDDEGASGFFYMDAETIVEEYGDDSAESRAKARELLKAECSEMGQYIEQDIYGYIIRGHGLDEVGDSCWGFYGLEYAQEEANQMAEWLAAEAKKRADEEQQQRTYWANQDLATEVTR